jgi:hypothetical protein
LTRDEVRRSLLADKWGKAISKRFSDFFEVLIDAQLKAQRDGDESQAAFYRAVFLSPATESYTDQLFSEASDDVIVGAFKSNLGLMKGLLKLDPKVCAGLVRPDQFPMNFDRYVKLTEGPLATIMEQIEFHNEAALFGPVQKQKRLTKKELAVATRRFAKVFPKVYRQFTTKEMKRIMSKGKPVKGRDEALFCRYYIASFEVLLKNPDAMFFLFRHGAEFLEQP